MSIAAAIEKMIRFYNGNKHDVAHFIKVHAYARTIGELECLDPAVQQVLELAAIVHDIACPYCRKTYGSAIGSRQEEHGPAMAEAFLLDLGYDEAIIARVAWLGGHHHTYQGVDGMDYQILLEADYLVNADEGRQPVEAIRSMRQRVFRTAAGTRLLDSIYLND